MARKPSVKKVSKTGRWQSYAAGLLMAVALLSFIVFSTAHWVERQFLTTDNWVQLVAPLPKDPNVSWSLADYSVDRLFSGINVEAKVADALPNQAAFLAKPLTERVENRAVGLAQDVISSDRFQAAWIAANREAHQRLMDSARADGPKFSGERLERLNLKLDSLTSDIRNRLGVSSDSLFDGSRASRPGQSIVDISVNLQTSMGTLRSYVKAIDIANATLGLGFLAAVAGALVFSADRRRLFSIMMLSLIVISLLQLIGVRVLRPEILNEIERADYRPAVAVVYDELTASYRRGATSVLIASAALLGLSVLAGSRIVKNNRWFKKTTTDFKATAFWSRACGLRLKLDEYRWYVIGAFTFALMVYMAFVPEFDWVGLVRAALATILFTALVHLIIPRRGLPLGKRA